ncbi:hypothetical protein [Klenkia terrae]|uniref:Epimerase n=1 Tax=Klenkia terrae TaxID=1052259 RepID=A0ABU8E5Y6_9ACTN|nr:hypothetical protein [Klenkia terrae]SSC25262.1 NAD(P)-binding domain superfamily protein [Klenkia terrae]
MTDGLTVLVFGASGMVGQGVLRECLLDDRVREVRAVVRAPLGVTDPKLREVVGTDLALPGEHLAGVDATFDSVGVSSSGRREPEYRRLTYDLTVGIARAVADASPGSAFAYVSGAGTDRDGRLMWARVKGETEDAVAALPLRTWLLRPGIIQPLHGVRTKTRLYGVVYAALRPAFPLLRRVAPDHVTTTEAVGRAFLAAVTGGASEGVLTTSGINALADESPGGRRS